MLSAELSSRLRGRNSDDVADGVADVPLRVLSREDRVDSKMLLAPPSRKLLPEAELTAERECGGVGPGMLWKCSSDGGGVMVLELELVRRLPTTRVREALLALHALIISADRLRTSTAWSSSASRSMVSYKPYERMSDAPPCSSHASHMLRITRRRFSRTTGFFALSF